MASSLGLFGLPPTVRRRIYCEAGLVVDAEIALHHEERAERRQNGGSIPDLGPSMALMLTCRGIHTEVSCLLYSKNTFFIRYKPPSEHVGARDLEPLRRLSPAALSLLTFLDIRLHVAARKRGAHHCGLIPRSGMTFECPDSGDEPLSSASTRDQDTLHEWQATIRHCSPYIRPDTLHLSLTCDVADLEMARRITNPLNQFPALASCHLRLGNDPDTGLLHIATDAAMKAQGYKTGYLKASSGLPFRFLDLAPELRLHILEYTDLVTPLSEVSWNPKDGYKASTLAGCGGESCGSPYESCHPSAHRGCNHRQCLQQPKCPHQQYNCWLCGHYACQFRRCWRRDRACFCSRYHAAYSPRCNCWLPPAPLFLVNRAFCADARATFFSQNHFTIERGAPDYDAYEPGKLQPRPERHSESIFLMNTVPASSLQYFRSLEFRSLSINSYPVSDDPADQDWLRTIDHVKDRINPRFVILNVYIQNFVDRTGSDFYDSLAEEGGIDLLKGCIGSFWPLKILGSSTLQEIYVLLQLGEEVVGYYVRPRHRDGPPYIEARLARSEMRSERQWRVSGYQSPEAQNNSNKVEGIWGYVFTY